MRQELLQRLATTLATFDVAQFPFVPAPTQQLKNLRRITRLHFGVAISEDYLRLLATVNGFTWNALTVFATTPRLLDSERELRIEGFVEENQGIWLDRPHFSGLLVFGYDYWDYFAYRVADSRFLVLSRAGEDVLDEFSTFGELLTVALERALQ